VHVLHCESSILRFEYYTAANKVQGSNCASGPNNFAVLVGCGDVAKVSTPKGNRFNRYSCGPAAQMTVADLTLETKPHNTTLDVAAAMAK
jgi:hypothetical protein